MSQHTDLLLVFLSLIRGDSTAQLGSLGPGDGLALFFSAGALLLGLAVARGLRMGREPYLTELRLSPFRPGAEFPAARAA
jgi:hypothetical protein